VGKGKRNIQNIDSEEAVLICNPALHFTQVLLQKCKSSDMKSKRILKINSLEVIASLTANGCGIGLLPACFLEHLYANKLKRVINAPVIKTDLYLIYRKEYVNVVAIRTLVEMIKKWARLNS